MVYNSHEQQLDDAAEEHECNADEDQTGFEYDTECCGCGGGITGLCRDTDDGLTDLYGDNCLSYAGMNRFEAEETRMPAEYGCGEYDAEVPGAEIADDCASDEFLENGFCVTCTDRFPGSATCTADEADTCLADHTLLDNGYCLPDGQTWAQIEEEGCDEGFEFLDNGYCQEITFVSTDMCCACGGGNFCRDRSFGAYGDNSYGTCVEMTPWETPQEEGLTVLDELQTNYCHEYDEYEVSVQLENFVSRDMCCACDTEEVSAYPLRWTVCQDLDKDSEGIQIVDSNGDAILDENDNDCDYYTEKYYEEDDQCGDHDTDAFVAADLCCVCFEHDLGLPAEFDELAAFNLPECDEGATPPCTWYHVDDADFLPQKYYMDFKALTGSLDSLNTSPVSPGDDVYSYFDITDWWIPNEGVFGTMTVKPAALVGDYTWVRFDSNSLNPIMIREPNVQPDFSTWMMSHATIRTEWSDLTDPQTYQEHVYYEFLYTIHADWSEMHMLPSGVDFEESFIDDAQMLCWYFKAEIKIGELYTFTKTTLDSDWKFEPRAAFDHSSGQVAWSEPVQRVYTMEIPMTLQDWGTDADGMEEYADLYDAYRGPVIATPPERDHFTINPDSTGSDLEVSLAPSQAIFIKMFTDDNTGACTDTLQWYKPAFINLKAYSDFITETDEDWDYSCRYLLWVEYTGQDSKPHPAGQKYQILLTDNDNTAPHILTVSILLGEDVICPTGQYFHEHKGQCQTCPEGVLSCEYSTYSSIPTECEPGFMLLEGFENDNGFCEETGTQTEEDCISGQFFENGHCKACMGRFENSATCTADEILTCYDGSDDDFNGGLGSALVIKEGQYPGPGPQWDFEYVCEKTGIEVPVDCAATQFLENGNCKDCEDRWTRADACTVDEPTNCMDASRALVTHDGTGFSFCEETGDETSCANDEFLENGHCRECTVRFVGASECTDAVATDCLDGYYLSSGACADCTVYFENSAACTNLAATECMAGYYLDDGACFDCTALFSSSSECTKFEVTACISGYYVDSSTDECEDCPSLHAGSTECDEDEATACDTGYTLVSGACVEGVEEEVDEGEDDGLEEDEVEEVIDGNEGNEDDDGTVYIPPSTAEASVPFEPQWTGGLFKSALTGGTAALGVVGTLIGVTAVIGGTMYLTFSFLPI